METIKFIIFLQLGINVLTVPMRNGNKENNFRRFSIKEVLTVPMRNGNEFQPLGNPQHYPRSYRTYEEWKLGIKYSLVSC